MILSNMTDKSYIFCLEKSGTDDKAYLFDYRHDEYSQKAFDRSLQVSSLTSKVIFFGELDYNDATKKFMIHLILL